MPFIAPRLANNNFATNRAPAPINRPPWMRGPSPSSNTQQGNHEGTFIAPWRKTPSKESTPVAPNPGTSSETTGGSLGSSLQEPPTETPKKTSQITINLKSVKKPGPVVAEPSKVIPISIEKENTSLPSVTTSTPVIPAQQGDTMSKVASGGAPAPPPPPMAPPPPPPPQGKTSKVEMLRKAPKKRPDWAGMMKEIEKGRVLNKVQCNDRSKPMLTKMKSKGKFVYESEAKPASKSEAVHNKLLNEITKGVKLKKVHCNDRSRPVLTGLRVGRQSSVIEGESVEGAVAANLDSVNQLAFLDIDDLRDELQSAKQLLQSEVDSKQHLERKARDQKCQIIAMEAEIETLKAKLGIIPEEESVLAKTLEKSNSKTFKQLKKSGSNLWKSPSMAGIKKSKSGLAKHSPSDVNVNKLDQNEEDLIEMNEYDEEIASLKDAVQHAKKQADEMEAKYKEAIAKLQSVQTSFEESEHKNKLLESRVETLQAQQDGSKPVPPLVQTAERTTQTEEQILEKTGAFSRQQSTTSNVGDYPASDSDDELESDVEVDEEALQKKKQERELKLWENKVKSVKDKQNTSRLERKNLKNLQKKLEDELKEANKRHKKLQKEVDKMAKMLKEAEKELDSDDEEDEDEEKEEEPEEEEETESEESEEEESESEEDEEEESSEDDVETGTYEDRLNAFGKRVKKRENVLNAMRKGNYLLRANIDRLKDELEEARISYHELEHELNSVLDET